jgi:hypothetical protein
MMRNAVLVDEVRRLGLVPEDFLVHDSAARAAPVADVIRGYLRTRRYTDVGPGGFGLHEIVDDGRGSFVNRKVERPS